MTEIQFITQNEPRWKQLEAFNQTLQRKGIRALSRIEIRDFADVFRAVGYHLAYARTHFPDGPSLPYLTHIVGVAHNFYYVREKSGLATAKEYFLRGFPAAVRQTWQYSTLSAIIFLLGTLFAYAYVAINPQNFDVIFPFELQGGLNIDYSEVVWDYSLMSAYIMTNNIRVSIMAFAFGITAGIGTVWILFYNGLIIGALASYVDLMGNPQHTLIFWSLILPHGVPELAAIFLSGGCGLMIGRAMLMPGSFTRRDAVIKSARKAVGLMPGIVVLLILAGLI